MFVFSKLFTFWFLPPGVFIVLLFFSLIFYKKSLVSKILIGFALVGIYLLSIEPVKNLILSPLENEYPFPKMQNLNCKFIVVLGGGEIDGSPAEGGKATVKPQVAKRLFEAFKVWKDLKVPVIVTGGKVLWETEPEADAMKRFLTELGVPEKVIWEETRSKNTFQNALFVKKEVGSNKVCLVTSAYHMPRSVLIFRTLGMNVVPVPADYRVDRRAYTWSDFMPNADNFRDSFLGLHEYLGILYFELLQKWRAREDSNLRPTD